jgi:hypothetical protein
MQTYKIKMSDEQMRQLLDLRRSSAASKHRNKKKYNRKVDKRQRNLLD